MTKSKAKSTATEGKRPLRAARAQISAPETTVRARYRSAIGVDVHLHLLVCCYQTQLNDHREISESRDFYTDRKSLNEFAAWCREKNPEIVLMESTGILWYSPYEALEDIGFSNSQLALINARDAKAAVGRKTDRKDAARLAGLARSGNFKKSFVPNRSFRQQRIISRELIKNKADLARESNRFQKLLNSTGCRASTVFSDIRGKAATIILDAKIQGVKNLDEIIKANCKRLRATPEEIKDALDFEIPSAISDQIMATKAKLAALKHHDEETFQRLRDLQKPYETDVDLLRSIFGIQERAARLIYAELCDDLPAYFEDSESFCSWLGICPGDNKSAGNQSSGKSPKGNRWLRRTLIECAHGCSLSGRFAGKEKFLALKLRRGTRRAIVAMAHFLARVVFSVLTNKKPFEDVQTTVVRDVVIDRFKRAVRLFSHLPDVSLENGTIIERSTGAILGRIPVTASS